MISWTAKEAERDAALLLLRDLDDDQVEALLAEAERLGLDTLVEAHDGAELERAIALDASVIGVNARDLSTFEIDRATQLELSRDPADRVVVAESGSSCGAGRCRRARGGGRDPRRLDAHARDRPGDEARRAALPTARQGAASREEDVAAAADAGADLLGFVLAPASPRAAERVLPVPARPSRSPSGWARPAPRRRPRPGAHGRGGHVRGREATPTGATFPSRACSTSRGASTTRRTGSAPPPPRGVVLAGGLGPENVADAIAAVRPWAVDASSSLETTPGVSDHARVRAYVEAARDDRGRRDVRRARRPVRPGDADPALDELAIAAWDEARSDPAFAAELDELAARTSAGRRRSRSPSASRPAGGCT